MQYFEVEPNMIKESKVMQNLDNETLDRYYSSIVIYFSFL